MIYIYIYKHIYIYIYIYIFIYIYIIFNNHPTDVHGCQHFDICINCYWKKLVILPIKHVLDLNTIINKFSIYDQFCEKENYMLTNRKKIVNHWIFVFNHKKLL